MGYKNVTLVFHITQAFPSTAVYGYRWYGPLSYDLTWTAWDNYHNPPTSYHSQYQEGIGDHCDYGKIAQCPKTKRLLVRLQLCTPALTPQAQTLSWDQHGHIRIAMACRCPQHTPQWTEPSTLQHHALLPPLHHVWRRAEGNQVNNSQPEQDPWVLRHKGGVRSINQPTVVTWSTLLA